MWIAVADYILVAIHPDLDTDTGVFNSNFITVMEVVIGEWF